MHPLPLPVRVVLAWVAIYPLVLLAQIVLRPVVGAWPGPAGTALVMALVVPVAVLWAVPALTRTYLRLRAHRDEPAR